MRVIAAQGLLVLLVPAALFAQPGTGRDEARLAARRTPVVEAYERTRNSVVNIAATERVIVDRWGLSPTGEVFPPHERNEQSVGSGFVIHEDGYIVTNAHVVAAGTELRATFADGREYEASIVAGDRERDLAVIKINPDRPLTPIPLGRSDDLMIGELTIAIGNPVGLQNTVTTGIVSALHRELRIDEGVVYRDVIQTDASINRGNSGGPLVNVLGELIGINTAIRGDAQNIGFAIPVDQLRDVLPGMLDIQKLKKVQTGLRVSVAEPPRVVELREDGPAAAAGLQLGDSIVALNGRAITGGVDFYVQMLEREAGEAVHLDALRGREKVKVQLELVEIPKPDGRKLARERLGIEIADIHDPAAQRFNLSGKSGVVVTGVEADSPAARAEIRAGDVLVYLDQYRLSDPDEVGAVLNDVRKDEPVDIVVWRVRRQQKMWLEGRLYAR